MNREDVLEQVRELRLKEEELLLEYLWNEAAEGLNISQWDGISDDFREHFRRIMRNFQEMAGL